jgi:hypothetical protein
MSLNLLYSTIHVKIGSDGKESFVLTNPRSQKSMSFFRSGMARLIEELYKAREVLNKKDWEDGVVYHGIISAYKNYVYGVTANIYQKRKFIWCRLYVKNDPGEESTEYMNDDTAKAGVYVAEFDAFATRIGVMFSAHDPLDKLLEMVLNVPLDSWTPPNNPENDVNSPSAAGFVKSELNAAGLYKKAKTVDSSV